MREVERLTAEVEGVVDGDPWFGSSVLSLLDGVDASAAGSHVPGVRHSIWEVVLHMTAWARETARRLEGAVPGPPPEGDWPAVTAPDAASWASALADMRSAHEDLVRSLSKLDDQDLDTNPQSWSTDSLGQPITFYRIVAGIVQHDAYHCGQIAVLKNLLSAEGRGSTGPKDKKA